MKDINRQLGRDERIMRIGELLAKGVALLVAKPVEQQMDLCAGNRSLPKTETNRDPIFSDEVTNAILRYLQRVGNASPRDIQLVLDLPKATLFRKIRGLLQSKAITRSGATTAVRYRLTQDMHRNG